MRTHSGVVTVAALSLLVVALSAAAQRPRFEGEVEVAEVLLDVLVTDEDGNVVVGLEAADFRVEVEGEEVPVTGASFYSNRRFLGPLPGSPEPPVDTDDRPQDRVFVLLFYRPTMLADVDPQHLLRLPGAGRGSFRWAVQDLPPGDLVAVAGYDGSLELHHDLTRDRRRLTAAIEDACAGKAPERWPSRTEPPLPGMSLAAALPERDELAPATATPYDALRILAEALGTLPGRKNLLVFGYDLPAPGSAEWQRGYQEVVETLNGHNVAVYPLGVSGRGRKLSLEEIAHDTGGRYAYRFAEILDPLRHIGRETSGYYLLSFASRHPRGETGYRRLEVSTVDPGFVVRSRRGYRYGSP